MRGDRQARESDLYPLRRPDEPRQEPAGHARDDLSNRIGHQIAPLPLQFQSGTAFDYSNSDIYVLGVLIENVTGQSYGQYLQTALLQPNGLNATNYGPSPNPTRLAIPAMTRAT
jgi:CubicO group peptidase (beta-lactamase class C family)